MLVLTRKRHQRVYIGDDIIIEVLACTTGGVKLGFSVPKDVPIVRDNAKTRVPTQARAEHEYARHR